MRTTQPTHTATVLLIVVCMYVCRPIRGLTKEKRAYVDCESCHHVCVVRIVFKVSGKMKPSLAGLARDRLLLVLNLAVSLCHGLSTVNPISPHELVQNQIKKANNNNNNNHSPLEKTVLFGLTPDVLSDDVTYYQVATQTRVQGISKIQSLCRQMDRNFQSDMGVTSCVGRVALVEEHVALVQWNVTWVPPTAVWIQTLGTLWPGVDVVPTTYNHLSNQINTFSWKAVYQLFANAVQHQQLPVPLACIEGTSQLTFLPQKNKLVQIKEDLVYAEELRSGRLQNRRCAADLRVFLETGRRLVMDDDDEEEDWDDRVAKCLQWQSVPGSNTLDVDPTEEGPIAAYVALTFAAMVTILFSNLMAPVLLGQPLWGASSRYIVPTSEMNDWI